MVFSMGRRGRSQREIEEEEEKKRKENSLIDESILSPKEVEFVKMVLNMDSIEEEEEKQKKIAKKILKKMPDPFTDQDYYEAYRQHTGVELETQRPGFCSSLEDVYSVGKADWEYMYIPEKDRERLRNMGKSVDVMQNLRWETLWRECREVSAYLRMTFSAEEFEEAYETHLQRKVPLRSCFFASTAEMLTKMMSPLGSSYEFFYIKRNGRKESPWKKNVEGAVLAACRALEMPFTLDNVCEKFSHQQGTVTCTKDTRSQLANILGSLPQVESHGTSGLFNYREVVEDSEEEHEETEKKKPVETNLVETKENEKGATDQVKKKRSLLDSLEEDEDCWPMKSGRPAEEQEERVPTREERPSSSDGSSNIIGRTEEKRITWPPAAIGFGKGKKKGLKTKNTTTDKNTGQKVNQKPQKPISHFFKPINGDKETSKVTKVSGATEEQNLSKSPPSMAEKMVSDVEKKIKQEDDGLEQVMIRDESAKKQEEKGLLGVLEEPTGKIDNFEEKNELRLTEEAAAKKVESEEPEEEQKPPGNEYSGDDSSSVKEVFTPVELSKEDGEISEQKEVEEEEEPKNSADPPLQNDFSMTSDEPGNEENDDWIVTDVDEAMTSEEKSESEREEPKDTGEGFGEEHMEGQTKEANGIKEGQTAIGDDDDLLENFSIASESSDCDVISIESFDANDDVYDVLKTSDWMENKENIPELPKAMEEPKNSVVEEDFDFDFEEEEPIDYGFNVNKEKKAVEKGRKKERSIRSVLGVKKTPTLTRFIDSDSDTEIWGKTEELTRGGEKMEKNKEKKQKKAKNFPSQTAPEILQKKKKERKGFKGEFKLPKKRHIDSDEEEEDVEMERKQKKKEKMIKKNEEDAPESQMMVETKSREKKPKKRSKKISVNL